MSSWRSAWQEYREAILGFSRPARLFLVSEFLAWTAHGIFYVLFNLYLVEGGFQEAFVGRAVSLNAFGLALAALPAGLLAERWGRRRSLILGAMLEGTGLLLRSVGLAPGLIYGASFVAGAGQALLAIAAAPFLTEHSTPRERTHLFSAFFALSLLAGMTGSILGGWLPAGLRHLPPPFATDVLHAYRGSLLFGALLAFAAALPLLQLRATPDEPLAHADHPRDREATRRLVPIGVNAFLIGAGAGLIIPFMNLYFAARFGCSSGQIGFFFSFAQVFTAAASLPFLITLGAESHLSIAVIAFWLRATFMQASSPLLQAFVMEVLPPALRARATSLTNLLWNTGWAMSATLAGVLIQRFGYSVPFYVTAVLYGAASLYFYSSFRGTREGEGPVRISEEAKGQRGEGAFTE